MAPPFKTQLVFAVFDFIERIPMSVAYDIILVVFLAIMQIGYLWIILRNDVVPPIGGAMLDVTDVIDDAETYIGYIIHEVSKIGIHIGDMRYVDVTQESGADTLAHLPQQCVDFETSWEVTFAFIDITNARRLCPAIRYVEPLHWLRNLLQWLINFKDYTSSCGVSSVAEICTYAGIGYIIHDVGLILLVLLLLFCAREIVTLLVSFAIHSAKAGWRYVRSVSAGIYRRRR
jgi:hypothetical protein